jgi:hypothetical protein
MDIEPAERAWRSRADLIIAVVFVLLGLAVIYGSWTMPRLEQRHIHPATIPGLVPGLLGIALTLCGGLLALKALRTRVEGGWQALLALLPTLAGARVLAVTALTLFHTLVLLGRIPFWTAASLFIFSFIVVFELWLTHEPKPWRRTLAWALAIALVGGVGIHLAFERIFLVRLP